MINPAEWPKRRPRNGAAIPAMPDARLAAPITRKPLRRVVESESSRVVGIHESAKAPPAIAPKYAVIRATNLVTPHNPPKPWLAMGSTGSTNVAPVAMAAARTNQGRRRRIMTVLRSSSGRTVVHRSRPSGSMNCAIHSPSYRRTRPYVSVSRTPKRGVHPQPHRNESATRIHVCRSPLRETHAANRSRFP